MKKLIVVFTILLLATVIALPALAAESVEESPTAVAERLSATLKKGDWDAYSRLMHPDALSRLKSMFAPIAELPEAQEALPTLFGVQGAEEFRKLTDREVFVRLMSNLEESVPGFGEAVRNLEMMVIGQVPEGKELMHVVFRSNTAVDKLTVTSTDVMTLRRTPQGWRALLAANIEGLAEQLVSSLNAAEESAGEPEGEPVEEPVGDPAEEPAE